MNEAADSEIQQEVTRLRTPLLRYGYRLEADFVREEGFDYLLVRFDRSRLETTTLNGTRVMEVSGEVVRAPLSSSTASSRSSGTDDIRRNTSSSDGRAISGDSSNSIRYATHRNAQPMKCERSSRDEIKRRGSGSASVSGTRSPWLRCRQGRRRSSTTRAGSTT